MISILLPDRTKRVFVVLTEESPAYCLAIAVTLRTTSGRSFCGGEFKGEFFEGMKLPSLKKQNLPWLVKVIMTGSQRNIFKWYRWKFTKHWIKRLRLKMIEAHLDVFFLCSNVAGKLWQSTGLKLWQFLRRIPTCRVNILVLSPGCCKALRLAYDLSPVHCALREFAGDVGGSGQVLCSHRNGKATT